MQTHPDSFSLGYRRWQLINFHLYAHITITIKLGWWQALRMHGVLARPDWQATTSLARLPACRFCWCPRVLFVFKLIYKAELSNHSETINYNALPTALLLRLLLLLASPISNQTMRTAICVIVTRECWCLPGCMSIAWQGPENGPVNGWNPETEKSLV